MMMRLKHIKVLFLMIFAFDLSLHVKKTADAALDFRYSWQKEGGPVVPATSASYLESKSFSRRVLSKNLLIPHWPIWAS